MLLSRAGSAMTVASCKQLYEHALGNRALAAEEPVFAPTPA